MSQVTKKKDEKIFEKLSSYWSISHLEGCKGCRGTYFYSRDNTWSFLDAIMIVKKEIYLLVIFARFKMQLIVMSKVVSPLAMDLLHKRVYLIIYQYLQKLKSINFK